MKIERSMALCSKKISALIRGIMSRHNAHFYCLNCLHLFRTKDKFEPHKLSKWKWRFLLSCNTSWRHQDIGVKLIMEIRVATRRGCNLKYNIPKSVHVVFTVDETMIKRTSKKIWQTISFSSRKYWKVQKLFSFSNKTS